MDQSKTAIILGATGLVGSHLLPLLLADPAFSKVISLGRRKTGLDHPKLQELVIDLDQPASWSHLVRGDILFSTFGTTRAQAGGKEAQYRVDVTYQYTVARAASANGVPDLVLVSTPGASPRSKFFYTRIRGELDEMIKALEFSKITLLKPSVLVGIREKQRTGEHIGIVLGNLLAYIPGMRKYRPIDAGIVAKGMIESNRLQTGRFEEVVMGDIFGVANSQR